MHISFVTAAVHLHVRVGCIITPEVNIMWKYVTQQIREIPGGLGKKREDWVEKLHQVTLLTRKKYANTRNK